MAGLLVVVEGMMGAGKSSLVEDLAKRLDGAMVLLEPDSTDESGPYHNPYLDDCNVSPGRWALTMQLHLVGLRRRMQLPAQHHARHSGGIAILDRSVWGDACFAKTHTSIGTMSRNEFDTYRLLFDALTSDLSYPDVVLWLDVPLDEILRRIDRRAGDRPDRASERDLQGRYLGELYKNMEALRAYYEARGILIPLAWGDVELGSEARDEAVDGAAAMLRRLAKSSAVVGP